MLNMTEACGKMTANAEMSKFNKKIYGSLLATVLPQAIENDVELDRMMKVIDALVDKGENISPEEEKLLNLLSELVEKYEDEHYPIKDAPPNEVLKFLMEQNDLKQSDLLHIFGSSGVASEVVNGKRAVSKAQAKALAKHFNISVEVFI
jgi:HTH-type transcriptional regulator/antitoxin HigA